MQNDEVQVGDTWTDPTYRGQGIATQALQYLTTELALRAQVIWYITHQDNYPSQKVAHKNEYRLYGLGEKRRGIFLSKYFIYLNVPIIAREAMNDFDEAASTDKEHFEKLYSASKSFANEHLRGNILEKSERHFRELLKQFAPNTRALEIGCGCGEHSIFAALNGSSVVGLDIAPSSILQAQNTLLAINKPLECLFQSTDVRSYLLNHPNEFSLIFDHESFASFKFSELMSCVLSASMPNARLVGIESFSSNPIFKLNRFIGYKRGRRTRSEFKNAFSSNQLKALQFCYSDLQVQYYHILTPFTAITIKFPAVIQRLVQLFFNQIDTLILKIPLFRFMAFKVVFCAHKPRKELLAFLDAQKYFFTDKKDL